MEKIPFTKDGLKKLKEELNHLVKVERANNIQAIADGMQGFRIHLFTP